jgi:hypothetical protein
MTVANENSMLKHRNVDLNAVSLKASDCTVDEHYNGQQIGSYAIKLLLYHFCKHD